MRHECPNQTADSCPYYPDGYTDTHHTFYPRSDYKTRLERKLRRTFTEVLCRCDHETVHRLPTPEKPTPNEILLKLGRLGVEELA